MNEIPPKEINILLLSTHSAGVTSLIYRMLYDSYKENIDLKQQFYSYKMLYSEGLTTINFIDIQRQNRMVVMDSFNYENKTIVIFVYNSNSLESLKSLGPLYEEVKQYAKEYFKNIKFGLIGNKLDLINEKNVKNLKKKGEEFADKINAKILFASAKTGKGEPLQFILHLLNSKLKSEIIPSKMSIIKDYIKTNKSHILNNIVRCPQCKIKIGGIKFHEHANKIELYCKNHPKLIVVFDYKDYYAISQTPKKCKICDKKNQEKNNESLIYCKKCEDFICIHCTKKHKHNSEDDTIYPYYIEDQLCDKHKIKNDIYCLNCNQLFCNFCYNNSHLTHKSKFLNSNYIDEITSEKYKLIKEQREQLEIINNYCTNIIETIKKMYTDYINKKNLELQIKENILNHFKAIKYNNELFNTVLNMKFDETKKLDDNNNLSITEKLITLFNYFEQPINITNYNLCSNINSESKEKESIKSFKFSDSIANNKSYYITDICKIYNDYYGISFNDGSIKIYNNNDISNHLKICKLFEEKKGVNSMINYNNKNIIYASGYEKIYKISINRDLNLNFESIINHENLDILKLCKYTLNNSILYPDNIGNIHIYNLIDRKDSLIRITSGNIIGKITDFENISDNIFYIKYDEMDLEIDINISTIDETMIERENSPLKKVNKVFYLHKSNEIYNEYTFNENVKILGIINKEHLIIQEDNYKNNIQYKIYNFKNKKEISFGNMLIGQKKDRIYKIIGENPDTGLIYFLMVDNNFNVSEFSFNPIDKKVENIGIMTNNNLNMYTNKIANILLFKKSLILLNDKDELSQIYY